VQVVRALGPATGRAATDFARKSHLDTLPRVRTSHKGFIAA
jgi:hypothetical protein